MPFHRSIRVRRNRKEIRRSFDLQLTPMLDVLVIILVFLLKTAAVTSTTFTSVAGIELPVSESPDVPPESLQLIVTPEAMTLEDQRIMDFVQSAASVGTAEASYEFARGDLDEGGRRVVPLYDALVKAREKAELLRAKSKARDADGNPLPFDGVLAVQADKRIAYDTIRKVMYTAYSAGYTVFRFLALRKDF